MRLPLPEFQTPYEVAQQDLIGWQNLRNLKAAQQQAEAQTAAQQIRNQFLAPTLQQQLQENTIKNKYLEPQLQQQIALLKANVASEPIKNELMKQQTKEKEFYLQNPFLKLSGPSQQFGAQQLAQNMLKQGQITNDQYNNLINSINTQQNLQQQRGNYYETLTKGRNFQLLPQADREQFLAEARGMGIEPSQAITHYNEGKTLNDLAILQGFDPNNRPPSIFPSDKNAIKQMQLRKQNLAELEELQPKIAEGLAPYSRSIAGLNIQQIKDAFRNELQKDPNARERQARFLASRALFPELQALRLKSMSGNVNAATIQEMESKTFDHLSNLQFAVDPETYRLAYDYVEKMIQDAANAANRIMENQGRYNEDLIKSFKKTNGKKEEEIKDYRDLLK